MPGSAGSERPPDASEIISRAAGGARIAPGSRAAMAHGDPSSIYDKYKQAADPQWEQFQNASGEGVPPLDVMGMIDLAGGDAAAEELLSIGPYEVIPTYDGSDIDYGAISTGEYYRD